MERADAAVDNGAVAVADLVVDVGCGEDGHVGVGEPLLSQSPFDSPLASPQLSPNLGTHSKLLSRPRDKVVFLRQTSQKCSETRVFSDPLTEVNRQVRLIEV